ncbi:hypothetical protein [Kocuria rosea]|uniref:Uncharacterized protein n=1 Tax=Kocuria rosea TaxID=1275 RepID=A0A4V3B2X2_KOCRO|nr:hypothetical protein [Kocuria rosea]TDL42479.1 hypothetical protein E2R59_11070 [Kocuria rosea]
MTPDALAPVLLAVAGSILALAGLMILTSRRRRSITAFGAFVLLTGLITISPTTASETANTAVTAASEAITGFADRGAPDPDLYDRGQGEIVAVETPAAL